MERATPPRRPAAYVALALASAAGAAMAQGAATATEAEAGGKLFGAHCARCHGADAKGTAQAPNLITRIAGMSEGGFSAAVLQRYRWSMPATAAAGETGARDALLRGVLQPRQEPGPKDMPAWQSQAEVAQGVKSLYAWLASRPR